MPPLYTLAGILVSLGGLGIAVGLARQRAERRGLPADAPAIPEPAAPPLLPASMPNLLAPRTEPRVMPSWKNDFTHHFPRLPPRPPEPVEVPETAALPAIDSAPLNAPTPVAAPEPVAAAPGRYVPPPMPEPQKLTTADLRRGRKASAKLPARGATSTAPPKSAAPALPVADLPITVRVTTSIIRRTVEAPRPRRLPPRTAHPLRGSKYLLVYGDAFGEVTEREIRLERVTEHAEFIKLHVYCYLKHDRREFRSDRIVELYDLGTGARIADPEAHFLG